MTDGDEPTRSKSFGTFLLVVGGVSAVALAIVADRIATAASPLCDTGFPGRQGQLPTSVFVFTAIGAFALGHLTGSDRIRPRRKGGKALGDGQWTNTTAIVAVNAGVAVLMFVVTALMIVEALTLAHHVWPITYYTRCANVASTPLSLLGSATYAFIVGRWLWVFRG